MVGGMANSVEPESALFAYTDLSEKWEREILENLIMYILWSYVNPS